MTHLTGLAVLSLGGMLVQATSSSQNALLMPPQVNELCSRIVDLMNAEGVAVPDLLKASAPVIENTRQGCVQLKLHPGSGAESYNLLTNVRAYLALTDAVPRPYPFPEAAQKQLAELRDDGARLDAHFRALTAELDRKMLNPDPASLSRYTDENRRLRPPADGKMRVVFFGDSITDYWRLNQYFPDADYLNRGIAGQTTGQLLQRVKQDVVDLHPAAAVILAGTNDLLVKAPPAVVTANYQALADLLNANKIKVIFSSVTPVTDAHKDVDPAYERTADHPPAQIRELNDWLKQFCAQRGYVYLDYYTGLADEHGALKEDLSDDGLHPNAKGYRIMAPLAASAIAKLVPVPETAQKPKKRGLASIMK